MTRGPHVMAHPASVAGTWPSTASAVVLARYPEGAVAPTDLTIEGVPVTEPADGAVLVRTLMTSVDPFLVGGGEAKVRHAREVLGADVAIDYRSADLGAALDAAPEGVDLFFDNVGGEQLALTVSRLRTHGRAVLCGRISETSGASPSVPLDLSRAVPDRLSVRGFIVTDHLARRPAVRAELAEMLADGSLRAATSVVDGLDRTPDALVALFRSGTGTQGKSLIRVAVPSV